MPPWLYVWIFRFARGERLEKAKPYDYRYWYGVLTLTPAWIAAFALTPPGEKIMSQGSIFAVWAYMVSGMIALWISLLLWAKWVPAKIGLIVGICVWAIAFGGAWNR